MSWANLANNQDVKGSDLLDAISNGLFTVKSGQTVPNTNKSLTKAEIQALINVEEIGGTQNQDVQKQEIISASVPFSETPFAICNNDDYVFVSDTNNHRVLMYPIGGGNATIVAGTGSSGSGSSQLNNPCGIYVVNNLLVIADTGNRRIVTCDVSEITRPNPLTLRLDLSTFSGEPQYPIQISMQSVPPSFGLSSLIACTLSSTYNDIFTNLAQKRYVVYNMSTDQTNFYDTTPDAPPGNPEYVEETVCFRSNRYRFLSFTDFGNRPFPDLSEFSNLVVLREIKWWRTSDPPTQYFANAYEIRQVVLDPSSSVVQNGEINIAGIYGPIYGLNWTTANQGGGTPRLIKVQKSAENNDYLLAFPQQSSPLNLSGTNNKSVPTSVSGLFWNNIYGVSTSISTTDAESPIFILCDNLIMKWAKTAGFSLFAS